MGCNDYNLHLDSSSGEQPTPEFKIYLDGVGVKGYSPTVDIVNSTSSSFQIQVNDIDGIELTSPIPKLDYITGNYVSNTSLASTLVNYSTTSEIASAYLKVDGSNANNPISINGHTFQSLYNGLNTKLTMIGAPAYIEAPTLILRSTDTGKVYYKSSSVKNELATIGDIPTIGNGTITITQGGVNKGTFTTNQSGNTTINLDAGGGSITNPLEIVGEPYSSSNAQQKITIKAGTGSDSPNDIELGYRPFDWMGWITKSAYLISQINNPLSISSANGLGRTLSLNYDSNTLGLNAIGELAVKGMVGADGTNAGSAGLVPAPTATDNTKFLRGDGTWQTVDDGGSSYTAGTGIDITNDVISIDTSVVESMVSGWGFTKNVGTVTSVNNIQPDSNGNVTVTPTITVIDGGNA